MHIGIIGAGFVGNDLAVFLAADGHAITCVDKNTEKIRNFTTSISLHENSSIRENNNISYSTSIRHDDIYDIIFITVDTPINHDNNNIIDDNIFDAVEHIISNNSIPRLLVIKSTVPVGTARKISNRINECILHSEFTCQVIANPEFLRQGKGLADLMHSNRIVIGLSNKASPMPQSIAEIYKTPISNGCKIIITDFETAEFSKLAANTCLATRISLINEIADICDSMNLNIADILSCLKSDPRIGDQYLDPSFGYAGSCLPKDVRALIYETSKHNLLVPVIKATNQSNTNRVSNWIPDQILSCCNNNLQNKKIALWGLSFKKEAGTTSHSPILSIIPWLTDHNVTITLHDPHITSAHPDILNITTYPDVSFISNMYQAILQADLLIIMTDEQAYKDAELNTISTHMNTLAILDLRNIYLNKMNNKYGIQYYYIGGNGKL